MFHKHQKRWFIGMVGKTVLREATAQTPASVRKTLIQVLKIESVALAESNYNFHRDYKINYSEVTTNILNHDTRTYNTQGSSQLSIQTK
jgi:hypothetical protein